MKNVIYFKKKNWKKIEIKYYCGYTISLIIYSFILIYIFNITGDNKIFILGYPIFIFMLIVVIFVILYNKRFLAINTSGVISIPGLLNSIPLNTYEFLPSVSPTDGICYKFHISIIHKIYTIDSDLTLNKFTQKTAWEKKIPMHLVQDTKNIICIELKEPLKRNIKEAIFYNKKNGKYHSVDKNYNSQEIYLTIDQPEELLNLLNEKLNKHQTANELILEAARDK
jgi:hypothetical protein